MFKRLIWWAVGAGMGAAGSQWAQRRVKRRVAATVAKFVPPQVANNLKNGTKQRTLTLVGGVRNAVDTGRVAAAEREQELRQRLRS